MLSYTILEPSGDQSAPPSMKSSVRVRNVRPAPSAFASARSLSFVKTSFRLSADQSHHPGPHSHLHGQDRRHRHERVRCRSIVHEFAHRYGGVDDAKPHHRCKNTTNRCLHTSECPAELTPEKALDNADSYAGFAYELWPITL
jgi:hypothetical protein